MKTIVLPICFGLVFPVLANEPISKQNAKVLTHLFYLVQDLNKTLDKYEAFNRSIKENNEIAEKLVDIDLRLSSSNIQRDYDNRRKIEALSLMNEFPSYLLNEFIADLKILESFRNEKVADTAKSILLKLRNSNTARPKKGPSYSRKGTKRIQPKLTSSLRENIALIESVREKYRACPTVATTNGWKQKVVKAIEAIKEKGKEEDERIQSMLATASKNISNTEKRIVKLRLKRESSFQDFSKAHTKRRELGTLRELERDQVVTELRRLISKTLIVREGTNPEADSIPANIQNRIIDHLLEHKNIFEMLEKEIKTGNFESMGPKQKEAWLRLFRDQPKPDKKVQLSEEGSKYFGQQLNLNPSTRYVVSQLDPHQLGKLIKGVKKLKHYGSRLSIRYSKEMSLGRAIAAEDEKLRKLNSVRDLLAESRAALRSFSEEKKNLISERQESQVYYEELEKQAKEAIKQIARCNDLKNSGAQALLMLSPVGIDKAKVNAAAKDIYHLRDFLSTPSPNFDHYIKGKFPPRRRVAPPRR